MLEKERVHHHYYVESRLHHVSVATHKSRHITLEKPKSSEYRYGIPLLPWQLWQHCWVVWGLRSLRLRAGPVWGEFQIGLSLVKVVWFFRILKRVAALRSAISRTPNLHLPIPILEPNVVLRSRCVPILGREFAQQDGCCGGTANCPCVTNVTSKY